MRIAIANITPSDQVNWHLRRYMRGVIDWGYIAHLVMTEVREGRFNPEADLDVIHQVTVATYDGNGRLR